MKKIKFKLKSPIKKWKRLSKKKKIISSVISVVVIGALIAGTIFIPRGKQKEFTQAVAKQTTVTKGNISNTIVGTGNLETDAANSVTVPSGITIKKVKVESGDAVSKGDTLATVDKTSVLEAIESVQTQIEELDEEINDCEDSDDTETITTKVSGTVKKIYVDTGDSVTDCIAENGALIVIELDEGDKLKITASGGTVSKIHVSKNEEVSAGDTLLTIESDEQSTEYKKLIAQRKALAKSLQKLVSMSQTGKIVADIDGIVGDVNVSDGDDSTEGITGSTTNKSVTASQMFYKTGSATIQSNGKNQTGTALISLSDVSNITETMETTNESEVSDTGNDSKLQLKIVGSGNTTQENLVLTVPETGNIPQSEIKSSDNSYTGTITWNPGDSTFLAGTTYSADVTLNAMGGFVFATDSISSIQTGLISGITVSSDGKTISFKITFPSTAGNTQQTNNSIQEEATTNQKEDSSKNQSTSSDNNNNINNVENSKANTTDSSSSGSASQSGSSSTKLSSSSSSTETTSTETDDSDSSYDSSEVTAFTLASNESMILSVNVDELDINSVSKDQEATITLDAIEDITFTGTVTKVGNSASSSGSGVAKYTVEITIPKDSQMKSGMNASATIIVENRENVLTLPVNALQERGNKVFVYTKQDDEGNLSGETEVTTGLSDGDNVEITEGLSEGDTVYYQKTGNTSSENNGGFFGGDMPEGKSGGNGDNQEGFGGRGNMGNMPEGGPGQGGM